MSCDHTMSEGPFMLATQVVKYHPESSKAYKELRTFTVDHCTKCGMVRIPPVTREMTGDVIEEELSDFELHLKG